MKTRKVPYRLVEGFTLKPKTVEEMSAEKEKYRELASASAKENIE